MPIEQLSQQSKTNYLAQQTRGQQVIEIKANDPRHSENQSRSGAQQIALDIVDFTSKATSTSQPVDEADTYQRPLSPQLQQNKILLEAIFDIEVQDDNKALAEAINQLSLAGSNSSLANITSQRPISVADTETQGLISIQAFGQSFAQDSDLVIMDTITNSQTLNYSTSGLYKINDQVFNSSFELSLSEKRVSMTQSQIPAITLKDPLLVQFGPRALGQLNEQSSDIDINSDGVIDSLPMFDGDVGYLVHDKNNNGKADDGSELFGPQSGSGFTDLSALDSNGNGFIDRDDDEFSALKLWQIDSNGKESWRALSDTNIEAISLNSTATPFNFYDKDDELQAQLTQSSVALTDKGKAYGVHQVDVRI